MSFLRKAREITGDVAAASKRQAQRGKLEIELRRLESRVNSEKDAIGHLLFPLLEAGTLQADVADVQTHMTAIKQLSGEIGERKAEIEALGQSDGGQAQEPTADKSAGPTGGPAA
jgi:hypothetical protein